MPENKKLTILTTYEDIDGYKVIRREDTKQVVRNSDIQFLGEPLDSGLPVISLIPEGYIRTHDCNYAFLPKNIVPEKANALGFFDIGPDENGNHVRELRYCNLIKNLADLPLYEGLEVRTFFRQRR